jgi:hypothetical protein
LITKDLIHKQIDTDENGAMQVNTDEIGSISLKDDDRPKIVVAYMYGVISVGVNACDRNNLLHDISRGLSRLNLKILHSEAAVIRKRSISVWKCTPQEEEADNKEPDIGEMYCVLEVRMTATRAMYTYIVAVQSVGCFEHLSTPRKDKYYWRCLITLRPKIHTLFSLSTGHSW